jgi:hypothetical protein
LAEYFASYEPLAEFTGSFWAESIAFLDGCQISHLAAKLLAQAQSSD